MSVRELDLGGGHSKEQQSVSCLYALFLLTVFLPPLTCTPPPHMLLPCFSGPVRSPVRRHGNRRGADFAPAAEPWGELLSLGS
ncbi:hypothetical protein AAFF_G00176490 [Aldrovandia affinis]|uniref:Uncharacterized protein n=1 Tax=Aldrovandia affinis TaxID=143900 RepID=A0AAD7W6K3_9TELE|nr:hypothetical protein AAFF_G00176490 [Aldrovandia affinis]